MSENMKQLTVNIEDIVPNPLNRYSIEDIEDLAGNISAIGLITPLTVVGPRSDNKYVLISGERRYWACKKINKETGDFKTVPIMIAGKEDLEESIQELMIESANMETRDVLDKNAHRLRVMQILKQMADNGEITKSKIVSKAKNYMKVSERYARMYKNIFEADDEELTKMVTEPVKINKDGEEIEVVVTVEDAAKLANMDEDARKAAMESIKGGESPKDAIAKSKGMSSGGAVKNPYGTDFKDDYSFEGFVDEYEDDDDDLDISMDAFREGSSDLDLNIDSANKITGLLSDNDTLESRMLKWAEKKSTATKFTETDIEIIDAFRELIEHYDSLQ